MRMPKVSKKRLLCSRACCLPFLKLPFDVFLDLLHLEAVDERVEGGGQQAVHHDHHDAHRLAEVEALIVGHVHEAARRVVQARDQQLRRTRRQHLDATLAAVLLEHRGDDGAVGEDDEGKRAEEAEHGQREGQPIHLGGGRCQMMGQFGKI